MTAKIKIGGGGVPDPLTADLDLDSFVLKSTTGDVELDATAVSGSDVLLRPNATGAVVVRQDGGTPGTDEVQISHDGTNGLVDAISGALNLNSASAINNQIGGSSKLLIQSALAAFGSTISSIRPTGNNTSLGNSSNAWFEVFVDSHMRMLETTFTPASLAASAEVATYVKDNKLIHAFDDAGTTRYKYLDMTGTGVTWVHTTTAP